MHENGIVPDILKIAPSRAFDDEIITSAWASKEDLDEEGSEGIGIGKGRSEDEIPPKDIGVRTRSR